MPPKSKAPSKKRSGPKGGTPKKSKASTVPHETDQQTKPSGPASEQQSNQRQNPSGGGGQAGGGIQIIVIIWFITAALGFGIFICAAIFLDYLVGSVDLFTGKGFCASTVHHGSQSTDNPRSKEMVCVLPVIVSTLFMLFGLAQFAIALMIGILTLLAMMYILGKLGAIATPFLLHIIFFGVSFLVALIHIIQQIRLVAWDGKDEGPVTAQYFFFATVTKTVTEDLCQGCNITETREDEYKQLGTVIPANFAMALINAIYCLVIAILGILGKI